MLPTTIPRSAFKWAHSPVGYKFNPAEELVLRKFFTNTDRKVFFIFGLPPSVTATLLSMYSRMENARGIRGHFVDNLLPLILLSFSERFEREPADDAELQTLVGEMQKFIKEHKLSSLPSFLNFSDEHGTLYLTFSAAAADPKYFERLASSPRFRWFMTLFLDKYGHNSIARNATFTFCVEGLSLLAAKSMEWGRPGAGYIELSTRFVRMDKAELYPFWDDLPLHMHSDFAARIRRETKESLQQYQDRARDGLLESFFHGLHGAKVPEKELANAVKGEVCDLLGNLLPAATLTSLGVSVSGEAFPELIRHLVLDDTPENLALADLIAEESAKVGGDQFLRHADVTRAKEETWRYLETERFKPYEGGVSGSRILGWYGERGRLVFERLESTLLDRKMSAKTFLDFYLAGRSVHDKLPNQFEYFSGFFRGVMSFRGWRDLHRQGFCTHFRTYLTPEIGFYQCDKPVPRWLRYDFSLRHQENRKLWRDMRNADIPYEICQYPLALGNLVGFQIGANLAQWEFVLWQRSKFSVNHEVRQIALEMDKLLCVEYSFWEDVARTDRTPAYIFSRTSKGIPCTAESVKESAPAS